MLSFPTRERGLKSMSKFVFIGTLEVVPHAGTWIEIVDVLATYRDTMSFPTRERGLK